LHLKPGNRSENQGNGTPACCRLSSKIDGTPIRIYTHFNGTIYKTGKIEN